MAVTPLNAFTFQAASTQVALGVSKAYALPTGSTPTMVIVTNLGPEQAYIGLTTAAASPTATQATVGSFTITVSSAASIAVGQNVVGAGISDGISIPASPGNPFGYVNQIQTTTVTGISGNVITLSQPTIAVLSSTSVAFINPLVAGSGIAITPNTALPPLAIGSNTYLQMICANQQSRSILNIAVGV